MNEYYVQVGLSLSAEFIGAWDPNSLGPIDSTLNMMFRFIGTKETASLVKSLKLNKSSHVDGISMIYLRDGLLITVTELCHILNESVRTMRMPSSWKIATITLIPKSGQSKHMVDYRPISVLPAPSKIIERAVYNQIVYHLESCGLLDGRQHVSGGIIVPVRLYTH